MFKNIKSDIDIFCDCEESITITEDGTAKTVVVIVHPCANIFFRLTVSSWPDAEVL